MINEKLPLPVYFKLQTDLKKQIENGRWAPGNKIPPERKLAVDYGLSIGTVKKALMNLVNEGYLHRFQGKGTFVKGSRLRRENLRYYRLLRHFKDDEEPDLTIQFIDLKKIEPDPEHIHYLHLHKNQKIYILTRLFLINNKPSIQCISHFPCKMFQKLEKAPVSIFEKTALYDLIENRYGITTVNNRLLFSSIAADPDRARLLNVKEDDPILFVEMLSFTYKNKIYEYRKSYCRAKNFKVYMEI
jgi:DNA-binding GntR family transcriptional regulator